MSVTRSLPKGAKVAVVGSGISGLGFSYFLSKLRPDVDITIFEKAKRHGGYIDTDFRESDGEKFERGPRTLRGASDGTLIIMDTLLKLGLKDQIYAIYKKSLGNKRYLLSGVKNSEDDYMVQVPDSSESAMKFLMSPLSKGVVGGVLKEPFKKLSKNDEDLSIGRFFDQKLGSSLNKNIISAVIHGIYGGDSSTLSLKLLMPSIYKMKGDSLVMSLFKSFQKNKKPKEEQVVQLGQDLIDYESHFGKPMIPFQNFKKYLKNFPMILFKEKGLSVLTDTIAQELEKTRNVKFVNEGATSVRFENGDITLNGSRFDHVRSTVGANVLAEMVSEAGLSSELQKMKFVDMLLVNIFIPRTKLYREGFGYLVPQSVSPQKNYLLGCIFDSSIEKNSVPLLGNNRHLVKLINYPNLKQEEINGMIKTKDTTESENMVKLTMMLGGHYTNKFPEIMAQSDRHLKKVVTDLIQEQFHLQVDFDEIIVNRIEKCIPQFEVGYLDYKEKVLEKVDKDYKGHLSLGGMSFNSLNGVGVPDCFVDSMRLAIELS